MTELSSKSICIYDKGQFLSIAERLSHDFGKVYYYNPVWKTQAPEKGLNKVGEGLPGVENIQDFWSYIPKIDCFLFPDVLDGDIQTYLEKQGKFVFGSRFTDELELDRINSKEYFKSLGIPIGEYVVIQGMTKLIEYLKKNENVYVKIDSFRGTVETFKSKNYPYIKSKLDEVRVRLGAFSESTNFIVETELPDMVEIGFDGTCIDGQYPTKTLTGMEIKDLGYVGIFADYKKLPEPVRFVNEKLSPSFKKYHCRSIIGSEIRMSDKNTGYLMDMSCRFTSPPSELMQLMYTNIAEIIWEGSQGNLVEPIPKDKYGVQLIMNCDYAEDACYNIQFVEKYKENIKLKNYCIENGEYQIIPQPVKLSEIGSVVATGETLDECIKKIDDICDNIEGFFLEFPKDSLAKAKEEIEQLKKMGIDLF